MRLHIKSYLSFIFVHPQRSRQMRSTQAFGALAGFSVKYLLCRHRLIYPHTHARSYMQHVCSVHGERVMLIHLYLSFMRFVVDVDEKISRIYLILIGVMRRKGERESERCINRVGKQRVKMSAFETCLKRPKAIAYAHT